MSTLSPLAPCHTHINVSSPPSPVTRPMSVPDFDLSPLPRARHTFSKPFFPARTFSHAFQRLVPHRYHSHVLRRFLNPFFHLCHAPVSPQPVAQPITPITVSPATIHAALAYASSALSHILISLGLYPVLSYRYQLKPKSVFLPCLFQYRALRLALTHAPPQPQPSPTDAFPTVPDSAPQA